MASCKDAQITFPLAPGCCTSCHEDDDEGYFELSQINVGGTEYTVCCAVHEFLQEALDGEAT